MCPVFLRVEFPRFRMPHRLSCERLPWRRRGSGQPFPSSCAGALVSPNPLCFVGSPSKTPCVESLRNLHKPFLESLRNLPGTGFWASVVGGPQEKREREFGPTQGHRDIMILAGDSRDPSSLFIGIVLPSGRSHCGIHSGIPVPRISASEYTTDMVFKPKILDICGPSWLVMLGDNFHSSPSPADGCG